MNRLILEGMAKVVAGTIAEMDLDDLDRDDQEDEDDLEDEEADP